MFIHKAKDTDKHEHFIKHLVYILTVTVRRGQWRCAAAAVGEEERKRAGNRWGGRRGKVRGPSSSSL
ncbi:hypothetical protein GW17_00032323 [Ensete ventricosum]|nr:hypothetical protein GW17_00032323 [Ensete ventricosum]